MDKIEKFITRLNSSESAENIASFRMVDEKEGETFPFPDSVDPNLKKRLSEAGIDGLYSHQAEGIAHIGQGKNIIVTTPTGSGKTLVYNIPVISRIMEKKGSRALYIFPTKALAQNQLRTIRELGDISAEIYDGDTPGDARRRIKNSPPDIILTNPEMLHLGILPFHQYWRGFLSRLDFVVIDEAHSYRGIFGSHVAHLARRLRRICGHYGSRPLFVLSSATVNKPACFAEKLVSLPFESVEKSTAPEGKRYFIFMDPGTKSPYSLAVRTFSESMMSGLSTILFTRSRRSSELLQMWAQRSLSGMEEKVSAYRAGYLPEERREIEKLMFSGMMKGIISTSALELGIDVGSLDCCILFGYPGSMTSTWQRIGRVGRGKKNSVVVFIGLEDALDRYFLKKPDEFFSMGFEDVIINPENPVIHLEHLKCACFELPIEEKDSAFFGENMHGMLRDGPFAMTPDRSRYCYIGKPPHRQVNMRTSGEAFAIAEAGSGRIIGETEGSRIFSECYPGSIYIHRGERYEITSIDIEKKIAEAARTRADFYTQPNWWEKIEILKQESSQMAGFAIRLGSIEVTTQVTSYEKRSEKDKSLLSTHQLSLPPQKFQTRAMWLEIPGKTVLRFQEKNLDFQGSLHAMEHAIIGIFPLVVTCDRRDIGGYSFYFHQQTKSPAVFIYDGYPGGAGIVDLAYERHKAILESALETVSSCRCEEGCPSCIQSPKCGNNNNPLDKRGAIFLLGLGSGGSFVPPERNREKAQGRERETWEYGPKKGGT